MKEFVHSILFLVCFFGSVGYGVECDQANPEITSPEACDQDPHCPRDSHPAGENCPHQDPSPH